MLAQPYRNVLFYKISFEFSKWLTFSMEPLSVQRYMGFIQIVIELFELIVDD